MKFPKRVPQHISESASFKLFSNNIPDNWIIREVTERDYGIDCYLEIVSEQNELKGELVLIQLKSKQEVKWNKNGKFTLTQIGIGTSNYWFNFSIPVFIFLCDLKEQKVYFESVHYFIRRNFGEYAKQKSFNYQIRREFDIGGEKGLFKFKFKYYYEFYRDQFENELVFFFTNLLPFKDFQLQHSYRDFHLGLDIEGLIFFESMLRNYRFMCIYLNIDNEMPTLREIKEKSKKKFGNFSPYELYEHDLAELIPMFESLTPKILCELKVFLSGESEYWEKVNRTIYILAKLINEKGELEY